MNNKYYIYGGLILLAIFLIWWFASRGKVKGKTYLSYTFFRQMDAPGGDIQYLPALSGNVSGLKDACDNTEGCIAFNTAGYLKSAVDPNSFKEYSGYPDWAGLYVKRQSLN